MALVFGTKNAATFLGLKFEACYLLGVDRKCPQMSIPVQIYAEYPPGGGGGGGDFNQREPQGRSFRVSFAQFPHSLKVLSVSLIDAITKQELEHHKPNNPAILLTSQSRQRSSRLTFFLQTIRV